MSNAIGSPTLSAVGVTSTSTLPPELLFVANADDDFPADLALAALAGDTGGVGVGELLHAASKNAIIAKSVVKKEMVYTLLMTFVLKIYLRKRNGFRHAPFCRIRKSRCGPVDRPVLPTRPITCPFFTDSPALTDNDSK
jgi:hypothetical protein